MEKGYTLVVTEKPKVSQRIAEFLSGGTAVEKKAGKAKYYVFTKDGKDIIVAPAVGHLYTLRPKEGQRGYPIFEIEWVPSHGVSKSSAFSKPYLASLKKLAKNASKFINACDYDIEGSLIGYNIIHELGKKKAIENTHRMKFSALTETEIEKAYQNQHELDTEMVEAGITRHFLDWYWGINTSRALSAAYSKAVGGYRPISAGRVQSPTLKVLSDREKEIAVFVPEAYWEISAVLENGLKIMHREERFFDKEKASETYEKFNEKPAIVEKIEKRTIKEEAPAPFNLSTLQSESYRAFKYSPKKTQKFSQSLYDQGLISYPRTSSQKLPAGIEPKAMVEALRKISAYKKIAEELLKKPDLKANEGKKTDPAHPCIYPTGEVPKKLNDEELRIFDLIARRFLASFGETATRQSQTVSFSIASEPFFARGAITLDKQWIGIYGKYYSKKEEELPSFEEASEEEVEKLSKTAKKTKPPARYSQATIVKKMETIGIGTKATRASILQTLYDRKYIHNQKIEVTDLGLTVVSVLSEHAPELTSEELTRKFEVYVESIKAGEGNREEVLEEARETLKTVILRFKEHITEIGEELAEKYVKTLKEQRTISVCKLCKNDLIIRRSRASGKQFIGCSGYPDCTNSYPLPQGALIVVMKKECEHDGLPMIEVVRKGKRKFSMCIDPACKSKEDWGKDKKKAKKDA
ncbi:TPA: DNA topoisomerase I [archaeon]|jgi:DNA topoisomerase-1|uniref:DNA topoisomerase 1 n=1 Tax=Candidatus Undinarchaeum marinum TaxID=2756141 RepID=A0A832V1V8_9ARCH|nr:DNA topoisomerase I [Candidatus Undinarchaeum marinum]